MKQYWLKTMEQYCKDERGTENQMNERMKKVNQYIWKKREMATVIWERRSNILISNRKLTQS